VKTAPDGGEQNYAIVVVGDSRRHAGLRTRFAASTRPVPLASNAQAQAHESRGQTALAPAVSPVALCPVCSRDGVAFDRESRSGGTPRADSKLRKLEGDKGRNEPAAQRPAASSICGLFAIDSDPRRETDASQHASFPIPGLSDCVETPAPISRLILPASALERGAA
jgi:hypothetical protein